MAQDDDEEAHRFLLHPPPPPPPPSMNRRATSAAANGGCGEIVEVQGGHIVRSTGRKDRHSKVCTAKGPRDRRVRLSAHTAIQFYDVQDRLGFDRPSKAVDWLIKKAKTSIDELAQLPPWDPADAIRNAAANAKPRRTVKARVSSPPQPQQVQAVGFNETSFLPPSMDTDSIADTIKTFFPVEAPPPHQLMHNYNHHQHPPDLLSRTNSQNQDLRLSLHSFPDGLHHHSEPVMFYGQSNPLGYDTSTGGGWEQQRLVAWNNNDTGNGGGGGGFVFAPPHPSTTSFQPVLGGQSQFYSTQRGPLQSSYSPMIRAWFDHPTHHHHQSISTTDDLHHMPPPIASGELFSSGFRVPARFQGQEEEQQHDKPSSASSMSRH